MVCSTKVKVKVTVIVTRKYLYAMHCITENWQLVCSKLRLQLPATCLRTFHIQKLLGVKVKVKVKVNTSIICHMTGNEYLLSKRTDLFMLI